MSSPAKGSDRREQILAAALALFVERGIAHVSTREIARAVGISQPSLYAHFATGDEIALELARRAFERLRARMSAALARSGTPLERLMGAARDYVAFGLEEPAAYRVAFMLDRLGKPHDPTSPAHVAGHGSFEVILDFVRAVRGRTDPEMDVVTQSCWASLHGLVSLLLVRPDFPWADRDALIEHHLAVACRVALGAEC